MKTDDLERIEEGHEAGVIQNVVAPYVIQAKYDLMQRLITMYRSGDTSHDRIVGVMGELTALDNLVQELEYKRRQGYVSQEKEYAT